MGISRVPQGARTSTGERVPDVLLILKTERRSDQERVGRFLGGSPTVVLPTTSVVSARLDPYLVPVDE